MIPVKPSVQIAVVLSAAHVGAAALLWLLDIPVAGKSGMTLVLAASLIYFMARYATLHDTRAIVALEIKDAGEIAVRQRRGEWQECVVLGSTFVSPALTIVNVRPRGQWRSRHIVLVPDNVDPADYRRLRTWLRWKGAGEGAAGQRADG